MGKSDQHKQCRLKRGSSFTNSWLPAKFAKVGKVLGLKDEQGNWEEGWVVDSVWGSRPSKDVLEDSQLWSKHREGTDAHREGGTNDSPGTWKGPRR